MDRVSRAAQLSLLGQIWYYYEGADLSAASKQLTAAMGLHAERLETYKAHAHGLAWQHSPYNPETQAAWEKLLVG